jgi:transcription initiation factor TFIIB
MAAQYIKKCPDCGGINLSWNREKGEIICRDCGLVIEDRMVDFNQEWREFDSEEAADNRRTGAPMTYTSTIRDLEPRLEESRFLTA